VPHASTLVSPLNQAARTAALVSARAGACGVSGLHWGRSAPEALGRHAATSKAGPLGRQTEVPELEGYM
jgi:hypothetical protein